jgi:hypothetical protein
LLGYLTGTIPTSDRLVNALSALHYRRRGRERGSMGRERDTS